MPAIASRLMDNLNNGDTGPWPCPSGYAARRHSVTQPLANADGVGHGVAVGQRAGRRSGQRVAGAVVVGGIHPRRLELVKLVAVEQQIGTAGRPAQMPAFDQCPFRSQRVQGAGRVGLCFRVDDVDVHQ